MIVRFFGPFDRMAEKEARMDLEQPISLRDLLCSFRSRYPGLAPYLDEETDLGLSAHIAFIRNGKPVKLDDIIEDGDTLDAFLPVTGGS